MNAQLPPYEDPELLARALERTPECPPLEQLAAAALGGPDDARREEVLDHADNCPGCSAELELALGFEREDASEAVEVDRVVARLRGEQEGGGRVLDFQRRRESGGPRRIATWSRWAAAALVVVGVGLAFQAWRDARPPELGGPTATGVVRGGELTLLAPVGRVEAGLDELVWVEVPGAVSYDVELLDVAGDRIASLRATTPRVELDEETRALLRARSRFGWRVTARDAEGAELARSGTVEFEVEPVEIK